MRPETVFILLFVMLGLGFGVKLWQGMSLCPTHDLVCLRGTDIDTYVALTMNESYQPFPEENPIRRDTEYPVAFLAMYPLVYFGGFDGFAVFMALTAVMTAAVFFLLAEQIRPGTGLYGAWLWLFNPLTYRLSLDLAQNALVNFYGIAFLALLFLDLEPKVPNFDIKNGETWKKDSWQVRIMFCVLVLLLVFTHQFGIYWLVLPFLGVITVNWLVGRYFADDAQFVAAGMVVFSSVLFLIGSLFSWRYFAMLAFPVTVALLFAPKKYWPLIATLMFIGYLIAPWLFGVPAI